MDGAGGRIAILILVLGLSILGLSVLTSQSESNPWQRFGGRELVLQDLPEDWTYPIPPTEHLAICGRYILLDLDDTEDRVVLFMGRDEAIRFPLKSLVGELDDLSGSPPRARFVIEEGRKMVVVRMNSDDLALSSCLRIRRSNVESLASSATSVELVLLENTLL